MYVRFANGKSYKTKIYGLENIDREKKEALVKAEEFNSPVKYCQIVRKITIPIQHAALLKDLSKEKEFDVSPINKLFLEHLISIVDNNIERAFERYRDIIAILQSRIVDREEM